MLIQSPLAARLRARGAEFGAVAGWDVALSLPQQARWRGKDGVGLVDLSLMGKVCLEGPSLPDDFPPTGRAAELQHGTTLRLRPDRALILTEPSRERATLKAFSKSVRAVTDGTHGRSVIGVLGGEASTLLRRTCGLDFHPTAFPDRAVKESSVAKTRLTILRWDRKRVPCYLLIGERSLADYLWETLEGAGGELEVAALGWDFFRQM